MTERQFRYEAVDESGIPIHGTMQVHNEATVKAQLRERGLQLVSCTELSAEALVSSDLSAFPRLYQLRVGEQLREAILTGLPADQAVRAIAREPLSHPMLGVVAWGQASALLVLAILLSMFLFTGHYQLPCIVAAVVAVVLLPVACCGMNWLYRVRPRHLLHGLADRLKSGQALPSGVSVMMPHELRCVMSSDVDENSKMRAAAELVPELVGTRVRTNQFTMTLLGPLTLLAVVILILYGTTSLVVPPFKSIFAGFGVELPVLTEMLIATSDVVTAFGIWGWVGCLAVIGSVLLVPLFVVNSLSAGQWLQNIPGIGLAFRWAMQARVARVLSAMIRSNCPYAESLRTATLASGFPHIKLEGEMLSKRLESDPESNLLPSTGLSALPISMLFASARNVSQEERRNTTSNAFQSLAMMLDALTAGQGRLLAIVAQFVVIIFTAFAVGIGVIALFLPLIKLLNDLS